MQVAEEEFEVTLYLDELKSEDSALKLNAVGKLQAIAARLSTQRVESELLPYLQNIILETDNEDEFLVSLCINLVELLKKNPEIDRTLALSIFEPLCVLEDQKIRETAIEGLDFVAREHFEPVRAVVERLSRYKSLYAAISALSIILKLMRDKQVELSEETLGFFDQTVTQLFGGKSVPVQRCALRCAVQFWRDHADGGFACLQAAFLEDVRMKLMEFANESMFFELMDATCLDAYLAIAANPDAIVHSLLAILDNDSSTWRVKYLILNNPQLFAAQPARFPSYRLLLDKMFRLDAQEVKTAVVRILADLLRRTASPEALALWHDNFAPMVAGPIRASDNYYVSVNFVDLLVVMLGKKGLDKRFYDESFEHFMAVLNKSEVSEIKAKAVKYLDAYFFDKIQASANPENEQFFVLKAKLDELIKSKNWTVRFNIVKRVQDVLERLSSESR